MKDIDNNAYFQKKVLVLNVFLTFVIVVLHSSPLNRIGIDNEVDYPFVHGVAIFGHIGVPMFYFISAILFYKDLNFGRIGEKLKRRVRSLLIPFLLWNTLFVAIYWSITHVSFTSSMMNMPAVPSDFSSLIAAVIDSKYTPLWFVKDLMIYCCLSPLFMALLNNKQVYMISVLGIIAYNIFGNVSYESIFHWMPVYMVGAYCGHFELYRITPPRNVKKYQQCAV